jgi:WD40 repeat protein
MVKIWDLENGHELLTYDGHKDKVQGLAWTPDGTKIVSAGKEKSIKIWNASTGKDVSSINATGEWVSALILSKDGKHIITGQHAVAPVALNGAIFVYETATGKPVRDLRDFPNKVGSLALSNDGTIVAAGDDNGNVRLFQYPSFVDNVNQPAYWAQQDPTGATYYLTFSPDDKTLVRVGGLGVKLYATPLPGAPFQVGAPRATLNVSDPRCAAYTRDGKTLYVGNLHGAIQLWDPEGNQKVSEFRNAHASTINAIVFSPQGNRMASCSQDFNVRLWDFDIVLQSRDFEGHQDPVWTAYFNSDGTRIVSASGDKTVKVWQRDTGNVLFTIKDHTLPVTVAMFSPDDKLIASAGGDKVIRLFDADKGSPIRTLDGHQGTVTLLDFSPDSKRIVSGGVDRAIIIWDADKGTKLVTINDNPSIVAGVAFHPKGKQIAIANIDGTVRVYDDAGKLQNSWNAHAGGTNGVAYSPNGQWLASCGVDMAVQLWPMSSPGQNAIRLTGHAGPVSSVAFRKDNQHLVSGGADQLIKLWKIEGNDGKEMQTFRGHKDWVTNVAFSKDGYHVISSSVDRRMKIWEITSRELPLLAEHTSAVECVAVSPNGEIIATGSTDRTIKLWKRATGEEIATLTGHPGAVMSLVFTPDSKRLVSSGSEASIRLWEVNPPREIQRTQQQLNVFNKLRRYSPFIATDPDGKTVFVWQPVNETSVSTWVEAFDVATGAFKFEFKETSKNGNRKINSLAFCANGKLAVTGAKDGSVRFFDLTKMQDEGGVPQAAAIGADWPIFADKSGVADLGITPDAQTLVATSVKGDIMIGKIQGREVTKTFKGHDGPILLCNISPDGKVFATVGEDNMIKAWSLDGKELRRWDLGQHRGMFLIGFAFTNDSKQIVTANANTTVYVLDLP